jgi:hypothetical protein
MATAGAIVGLGVPGVVVEDIATTSKTLPDFPGLWAGMLAGDASRGASRGGRRGGTGSGGGAAAATAPGPVVTTLEEPAR